MDNNDAKITSAMNDIDIYVLLQLIKKDPTLLEYYISVYRTRLLTKGISLDTLNSLKLKQESDSVDKEYNFFETIIKSCAIGIDNPKMNPKYAYECIEVIRDRINEYLEDHKEDIE